MTIHRSSSIPNHLTIGSSSSTSSSLQPPSTLLQQQDSYDDDNDAFQYFWDRFPIRRRRKLCHNRMSRSIHNKNKIEIPEPKSASISYPQQTPHSGRHFRPDDPPLHHHINRNWFQRRRQQKRRFMEGWYYRITIPEQKASFAIIISIEQGPVSSPSLRLVCIQIIGPNDEYLIRGTRDTSKFWAWRHQQGLGATFQFHNDNLTTSTTTSHQQRPTAFTKEEWYRRVQDGFQILPHSFLGQIRGYDGTKKGNDYFITDELRNGQLSNKQNDDNHHDATMTCSFDFSIEPKCGWGGNETQQQKSTGGWLSYYPIFEPHWQVTLADAVAHGMICWNNRTYTFVNASFYSEKNWGKALPRKWYWTQCNTFDGYEQLSVVAGGGIRQIPLWNTEETLGMVSIHYNNTFYEAVPWMGTMKWNVSTWGYWLLSGTNTLSDAPFEVEVLYTTDDDHPSQGLIFRAPTPKEGMIRFCRDTFEARTVLTLWELQWDNNLSQYIRKDGPPLIDRATSTQGGAEVGGGPWWDDWTGESKLRKPIKALLQLPYRLYRMKQYIKRKCGIIESKYVE